MVSFLPTRPTDRGWKKTCTHPALRAFILAAFRSISLTAPPLAPRRAAPPRIHSTVHFWAPMSKWMISGASFLELDRPTEKISIAQYTALTLTGFFFTRYALLVAPVNYTLW